MSLELYHPNEDGVVVYRTEDNTLQLDVQLAEETVWLAQQQMAVLFDTTKQNVSLHINNIFKEGELDKISVVKDYLTTASDGKKRWYCKTCQTYFTHVNHKASILNICFFILSCYLSISSAFWRTQICAILKYNFKFAQFFQHDFMKNTSKIQIIPLFSCTNKKKAVPLQRIRVICSRTDNTFL